MTALEIRLARLTQRMNRVESAVEAITHAMQMHLAELVSTPEITELLIYALRTLEAPDPLAGMRPDKENTP